VVFATSYQQADRISDPRKALHPRPENGLRREHAAVAADDVSRIEAAICLTF
jgi:hypothetical protein